MKRKLAITLIIFALLALPIMGCASSGIGGKNSLKAEDFEFMSDLDGFPQAEMTGYAALQDYDAKDPLPFVDVTVKDIHKLMEDKESFVLFVSFSTCPWCNAVLTRFIDVANEAGIKVASLNTRKNPEWESNMDIDDYDLFVADFDEQLDRPIMPMAGAWMSPRMWDIPRNSITVSGSASGNGERSVYGTQRKARRGTQGHLSRRV